MYGADFSSPMIKFLVRLWGWGWLVYVAEVLRLWGSFWIIYWAEFGSTVSTWCVYVARSKNSSPVYVRTHHTPCVRSKTVCVINEDKLLLRPGTQQTSINQNTNEKANEDDDDTDVNEFSKYREICYQLYDFICDITSQTDYVAATSSGIATKVGHLNISIQFVRGVFVASSIEA